MSTLVKFTSIFGANWVTGRYLLPELTILGQMQRGILLDLACGDSPFRAWFPMVEEYRRVDLNPLDIEVIVGDMLAIPQATQSVDMVLLFQAITDVPDPIEVLKEVRRVLRPGGKLVLFESMAYPEHDSPRDFYRLMPDGLRELATNTGFHVEKLIRLGGLFTRFASLWNTCVMGQLKKYSMLKPLAFLGVAMCNIVCYASDRLVPHPRLASDYLAVLTYDNIPSENLPPIVEVSA